MKAIGILIMAAVVFTAATAGSWWIRSKSLSAGQVPESALSADKPSSSATAFGQQDLSDLAVEDRVASAVKTEPVSVEELVRLGMDLKQRETLLTEETEKLEQQKIQQKLVFAEIEAEMKAIDELRTSVRSEFDTAENYIQRLIDARQAVIDEKTSAQEKLSEVESVLLEVDDQHQENTKKLALWIQSMDANKAAEVLREMSNDGKMTVAVEILSHLEEREAAEILTEIDDVKLVQDLVTEFRNLKSPQHSSRRKKPVR